MGLTKLIFGYRNFFCSGPFLIFLQVWWIEKMPQGKKIVNIKNLFLHAHQPREGIFDIRSHWCRIFNIICQSFKWLPVFQFWELTSNNEILRTISCIYFMKIWVNSWFSTSEIVLVDILSEKETSTKLKRKKMVFWKNTQNSIFLKWKNVVF